MRPNRTVSTPVALPCTQHAWALRPDASGRRVPRFWCLVCHAWGYVLWTQRGRRPLRVYRKRTEPDDLWFRGAERDPARAVPVGRVP